MTIREFNLLSPRYSVSEASQQERVRDVVFTAAVEYEGQFAASLATLAELYARFEVLEAFVVTNAADFALGERTDLQAVRDKIRQAIADTANGIPGVSGAVVA